MKLISVTFLTLISLSSFFASAQEICSRRSTLTCDSFEPNSVLPRKPIEAGVGYTVASHICGDSNGNYFRFDLFGAAVGAIFTEPRVGKMLCYGLDVAKGQSIQLFAVRGSASFMCGGTVMFAAGRNNSRTAGCALAGLNLGVGAVATVGKIEVIGCGNERNCGY